MVKKCRFCGKEFETGKGKPTKYCSAECRDKYIRKERYKNYLQDKKARYCSSRHGGCFECPYEDCIR